jgi:hypothetical protein
MIFTVSAAPYAVASRDATGLVIPAASVIKPAVLRALSMCRRPWRWVRERDGRRKRDGCKNGDG